MYSFTTATALIAASLFATTSATGTFTKTISYVYTTHNVAVPDCGPAIYHTSTAHCPSGCHLDALDFGNVKTPAYACKATAAAASVQALPVVAHLSCKAPASTIQVTPAYGAHWTTCGSESAGRTHFSPAVTVAVETMR